MTRIQKDKNHPQREVQSLERKTRVGASGACLIRLVQVLQRRRLPEPERATSPPAGALPPARRRDAARRQRLTLMLRVRAAPPARRADLVLVELVGVEAAHTRRVAVDASTERTPWPAERRPRAGETRSAHGARRGLHFRPAGGARDA